MLPILRNRTYRHLIAAQVIALLGTGLATVALGLLAFEIAGEDAGLVLGTALAIKIGAYVGIAPVASATEATSSHARLSRPRSRRRIAPVKESSAVIATRGPFDRAEGMWRGRVSNGGRRSRSAPINFPIPDRPYLPKSRLASIWTCHSPLRNRISTRSAVIIALPVARMAAAMSP